MWRGVILLAMMSMAGWLTGCMAEAASSEEERTGETAGALRMVSDDPDTVDPSDPSDPGSGQDPEPQPWNPGASGGGLTTAGPVNAPQQEGAKKADPEPQPWKPGTSTDGQVSPSSSSNSSSNPH